MPDVLPLTQLLRFGLFLEPLKPPVDETETCTLCKYRSTWYRTWLNFHTDFDASSITAFDQRTDTTHAVYYQKLPRHLQHIDHEL